MQDIGLYLFIDRPVYSFGTICVTLIN